MARCLENSPIGCLAVPLNIRCSRKWASPDLPGVSSADPTLYQIICVTTGVRWSGMTTSSSPLARVKWLTSGRRRPQRGGPQRPRLLGSAPIALFPPLAMVGMRRQGFEWNMWPARRADCARRIGSWWQIYRFSSPCGKVVRHCAHKPHRKRRWSRHSRHSKPTRTRVATGCELANRKSGRHVHRHRGSSLLVRAEVEEIRDARYDALRLRIVRLVRRRRLVPGRWFDERGARRLFHERRRLLLVAPQ